MEKRRHTEPKVTEKIDVRPIGYIALVVGILFFSGAFQNVSGPLSALDFTNLCGKFGALGSLAEGSGSLAANFRGTGGNGVKDGWMFALTLFPTVMFALGIVKIIEYLDGLKAAQKLLTPVLRPILGLPGIAGLTIIASFQSADAGASMMKSLYENKNLTEKERLIFCGFQFSAGAVITNYLSSGAALFPFLGVSISLPFLVIFFYKILGTNLVRLYAHFVLKEE